ncbi:MAG: hypothetical protein DCO96_03750 [Fluviicola sp. XM-24bin1]|nr:MAG: hypothetical protein DCO96_03750 [Fluviicola sp. XM-24bin1]
MEGRDNVEEVLIAHILKNIRTKTAYELLDIHQKMDVSLTEMISAKLRPEQLDGLALDCPEFLIKELDNHNISKEELLDAGINERLLSSLLGASDNILPEEPPTIEHENDLSTQGLSVVEKEELKNKIQQGKGSAAIIKNYLDRELITQAELESWGVDLNTIERLKNFYEVYFEPPEVNALPPLRSNASDVYFLGMPSSGKSTMLASLLAYSDRKSLIKPSQDNSFGTAYRKSIVKGILTGYLPSATPGGFVNYIPIDFRNDKNKWQKMNFLDMAGERFRIVASEGMEEFGKYRDYLSNNNRKALVFILDYFENPDNSYGEIIDQNQNLQEVMMFLENAGICEKTDAIYMVVTKADLFPEGDKSAFVKAYVEEHYANFLTLCKDMRDKYGTKLKMFPYSIGPTSFGFIMDEFRPKLNPNLDTYPSILVEQLKEDLAIQKKGWW